MNVEQINRIDFVDNRKSYKFTESFIRKNRDYFYTKTSALDQDNESYCGFCEKWYNNEESNNCPICNNIGVYQVVTEDCMIDIFDEYVNDNDLSIYINKRLVR